MRPPNDDSQTPVVDREDSTTPPPTTTTQSTQSTESIIRESVGTGMLTISDLVNKNLVAFRYGTVATVTLLTAYGLANTPLFFRYKTVAEIPGTLVCSTVPVEENSIYAHCILSENLESWRLTHYHVSSNF